MFTRHRLGPTNKLDCPHAMGINAFSPQRAKSFRHFLLLPSPHSTPSLRSVAQGRLRLFTTDASRQIFEFSLGARGVGACKLGDRRDFPIFSAARLGLR